MFDFQKIPTIGTTDFYIDRAFSGATKACDKARLKFKDSKKLSRIIKSRIAETAKIDAIGNYLRDTFTNTIKGFPSYDQLPEFYQEVLACMIDVPQMKKSLAAMNWSKNRISDLQVEMMRRINRCSNLEKMNEYRQGFYGRVSSMLKQVKEDLVFLELVRKDLRNVPSVDLESFSVAIAGFPNVGKSTLLAKLTSSKPEIAAYPFTTKGINIGYLKNVHYKIQVLDTPGTLDRFEKMNDIEKLAYLAMKHAVGIIIYIFDLTEEYPLDKQHKLFERIKEYGKETVVFLSKTDKLSKERVDAFRAQNPGIIVLVETDEIIKLMLDRAKKYVPPAPSVEVHAKDPVKDDSEKR